MSIPPTASRLLRWQDRHPVLTDSAVALLLLVFTCVIGFSQTPPFPLWSWAPASLVAMAPATAGLCLRRRYPITAWAAVVIAPAVEMLGASLLSGLDASALPQLLDFYMIFGAPLCLAAIAMRHHARWAFAAAFVSAAPTVLAERWVGYTSRDYLVFEYVALTLFGIIGVLVGLLLKVQRAQLQEFETRSTRLALAREQAAMLAAANERSRIAREMHDVVAHRISLIALHAGALAHHMRSDEGEAGDLARAIQTNAQSSLDELRAMLARLRGNAAPPEPPQPTLSGLDALLADARSAGQQVAVELGGDPAEVPDRVSRHAYRIIQEGLTNARKHAPGAPVALSLKTTADRLRVVVRNRLADLAQPDRSGSGLGLVGIAERVDLVGGDLSHGIEGGEFILEATLPYAPEGTA